MIVRKAETLAQNTAEPKRAIELCADFSSRMAQLVRQRSLPKSEPEKSKLKDPVEQYLEWLRGDEPVLVEEARKKLTRLVMEREDLEADWDEEGKLINVTFLG